jgi:hypothetical protein
MTKLAAKKLYDKTGKFRVVLSSFLNLVYGHVSLATLV